MISFDGACVVVTTQGYSPFNCPMRLASQYSTMRTRLILCTQCTNPIMIQNSCLQQVNFEVKSFDFCSNTDILALQLSYFDSGIITTVSNVESDKVVHGVVCLLFLFVCFITTTKAMTKDIRHSLTTLVPAAFSKRIVSIFLENSESI